MVTIFIITQNAEGQNRMFSFFAELEQVLDQLSYFRQISEEVTQAYVMDQGQRLDLPVDLFDGQSFSVPIQRLKQQWETILHTPLSALSLQIRSLIEFDNRQIRTLENHKQVTGQALTRAQQLRQQILSRKTTEKVRLRLVSYYENLISHYELQLTWLAEHLEATKCHRQELYDQLGP